jgi:histidinol dehydrogenase
VLPTGGAAAARGGLSAADFVRVATLQRITAAGLRRIAPAGIALATAEGLDAHAASLRIRTDPARLRTRERRRVRRSSHERL